MAGKKIKLVFGEVLKDKEDETKSYIKVKRPMEEGVSYSLETLGDQIESIERAVDAGKLPADVGNEIKEKVTKAMPDFVRFQITKLVPKQEK